jgi:outer membrane lipoprotein SlyB
MIKLFLAVAVIALSGCASTSYKPGVYQTGQVQQAMRVKYATVLELREVEIEGKPTGAGGSAGSAAGAVASLYAPNRGGLLTSIAGAVIGGVVGNLAEKQLSTKKGLEITYRPDGSADAMVVVQEMDSSNPIKVGDHIKIVEGSFMTKVMKAV